ncbi:biotin/lipoyl-containing protein [Comamonas sp. GB3 AK4-5]
MKMAFPVCAARAGTVTAVHCQSGKTVVAGQALLEIQALDA